jgi:hypothetical protein
MNIWVLQVDRSGAQWTKLVHGGILVGSFLGILVHSYFQWNELHYTKVELGHFQWNFGGIFGGLGIGFVSSASISSYSSSSK